MLGMTDRPRSSPDLNDDKHAEQTARAERLARALRENLHRRKDQARARRGETRSQPTPDGDEPPA
jgi:hypothetical protein